MKSTTNLNLWLTYNFALTFTNESIRTVINGPTEIIMGFVDLSSE